MQLQTESALELFESGLSKRDIQHMASAAVESVLAKGNPLQAAESLSAMELFIKEMKAEKKFTDYVREEAKKYGKEFTSNSGAKIEICETGTSYDYGQCGDVELEMLEVDFKTAEAKLKERREFLKKIPTAGIDVIVPQTGEVIHVFPPSKSSTSSYKVSLSR